MYRDAVHPLLRLAEALLLILGRLKRALGYDDHPRHREVAILVDDRRNLAVEGQPASAQFQRSLGGFADDLRRRSR